MIGCRYILRFDIVDKNILVFTTNDSDVAGTIEITISCASNLEDNYNGIAKR